MAVRTDPFHELSLPNDPLLQRDFAISSSEYAFFIQTIFGKLSPLLCRSLFHVLRNRIRPPPNKIPVAKIRSRSLHHGIAQGLQRQVAGKPQDLLTQRPSP